MMPRVKRGTRAGGVGVWCGQKRTGEVRPMNFIEFYCISRAGASCVRSRVGGSIVTL